MELLAKPDRPAVERRVLDVVTALLAELDPGGGRGPITLGQSLDRDLGVGSLERVELLLRLEQAFGIRLPDAVMAEADSLRQLVDAILSSDPRTEDVVAEPPARPGARAAVPESAKTLTDVLRWHAEATPDRVQAFLRDESGIERPITYGALFDGALAVAAGLRDGGVRKGDTVALMLRTEAAFFEAFFGVLLAEGVPVPLYPPFRADQIEEYARRQAGILRNAEARLLVTFAEAERVAGLLRAQAPSLQEVCLTEDLKRSHGRVPIPDVAGHDLALIQYTSGSTGHPKGVALTHANLLANVRAIGEALTLGPEDVAVSWLPLYHDMGLIGSWLGSVYFGVPIVLLSPLAFLSRPARWLRAFHAHRGTVAAAPNFAFDLCVRKISDAELEGLDLSSWRLALNGAEAVSPESVERFSRRFQPYGFKPEAMCPVYGLAESTVCLTVPPIGRLPRIDCVSREPFQRSREARPASPSEENPLRFVGCGRPIPGQEVRIVDSEGRPVEERVQGRIEFRGTSAMQGYFRNPEATRAIFRDGWIDSGDLGYWADGELFITGRQKEIIIAGGRNVHPQEVEEVVGDVPGIRKGCVAAFGVPDPQIGTERMVVIAETRERAPDRREQLRAAIVDSLVAAVGIPPDMLIITRPGAVLKTSSGKIRRGATRDAYLRGDIARGRRSVALQFVRLAGADLRRRLARVSSRAAMVVFTSYVGLLFLLSVPLLWLALFLLPTGPQVERLVKRWCRAMLWLGGCRPHMMGVESLRNHLPAMLVANHASFLDSIVLIAALPEEVRFVAKRRLLSYPLIGRVIRKGGHLPIERGHISGAEEITAAIRGGTTLLIFPEGTFVRAPGLLPFRLGAFRAAVDAERPIVPVAIRGTRKIWPDKAWLMRRGPIAVTVGDPLWPAGAGWPEMVRLRDLARGEIAHAVGEPVVNQGSAYFEMTARDH